MSVSSGTRFGPYEVLSPLGAGGMGEVYRARDTRLGREVAIKVLPGEFAADPDRIARFTREAQLLASLNHQNIAQIYGVEPGHAGTHVLVMELVDGVTLAERISQGRVPVDEALAIARQVAAALEAAHDRGIIHRDLKPANIKIRPDDTVKVLDFGLAKLADSSLDHTSSSGLSLSPTVTSPAMMTGVGVLMGTAPYMSPEQARGKPLDKRTDIWSFGAVLYELVTGRRAFDGEDVADTISKVLQTQPALDDVPIRLRRLIAKCLQRNPQDRLRDIGDAWDLLEEPTAAPSGRGSNQIRVWQGVAVVAVVAALALWAPWREVTSPPVIRLQITPPPGTVLMNQGDDPPAVSPDGSRVAFLAMEEDGRSRIWIRALDSVQARRLEGTDDARWLVWSPDGKWLAYQGDLGDIRKVPAAGGPAQTLCVFCPQILRGAWSSAGVLVLGGPEGLTKLSEDGGTPTAVTKVDRSRNETVHLLPSFLPDGRRVLYLRGGEGTAPGLYAASIDAQPSDQPNTRILATFAVYGSGRVLFVRSGTLMSQPFDVDDLRLTGEPTEIARNVAGVPPNSGGGTLAFGANPFLRQLTWFSADGKSLGTVGPVGSVTFPRISPGGTRVAFGSFERGPGDIWIYEPKRGAYQFTTSLGDREIPMWIDDGHIAYSMLAAGGFQLMRKAINGVGGEQRLYPTDAAFVMSMDISSDGKYALVWSRNPKTQNDIGVLPLAGDGKPVPYLHTASNEDAPRVSPNGKWLAYVSDKLGHYEVYVDAFTPAAPTDQTRRGTWPVSTAGGTRPVWSRDGNQLFFISAGRKMMSVKVNNPEGPVPDFGPPVMLFAAPVTGNPWDMYDVAPDGRFLFAVRSQQRAPEPITVLVNWPEIGT